MERVQKVQGWLDGGEHQGGGGGAAGGGGPGRGKIDDPKKLQQQQQQQLGVAQHIQAGLHGAQGTKVSSVPHGKATLARTKDPPVASQPPSKGMFHLRVTDTFVKEKCAHGAGSMPGITEKEEQDEDEAA